MKRVKTKAEVEAKMKERVSTAGKYLTESMGKAEDPLDIMLSDPKAHIDAMVKGIQEAQRTGAIEAGIRKAKDRDAWKKSLPRAGAHYEERTDDMVSNSLSDYDQRRSCIEEAQKAIEDMPKTTRAQRILRSSTYQTKVGECMDKLYGRSK